MTARTRRQLGWLGGCLAAWTAAGCASAGGPVRPSAFPGAPAYARSSADESLPSATLDEVLRTALDLRGAPYRAGGDSPADGFDCSGFVQYVFAAHQVDLPRTVEEQFASGRKVPPSEAEPGDLLFFSTSGPGVSHVGIALGRDEFVHAPSSTGVVRVEHLTPYWRDRLVGARRMQQAAQIRH